MPEIRQIKTNDTGEAYDCIEVVFDVKAEPWCEYELVDGGRLRIRNVLVRAWQVVDEHGKPVIKPDGDPHVLVVTSTVSVVVSK